MSKDRQYLVGYIRGRLKEIPVPKYMSLSLIFKNKYL